jgi:heptosyltransferase-2
LIDQWVTCDARPSIRSEWSLARRLRRERCDAALLLTNSLRSAAVAWWSRAPRRIGFDRDARRWLLTDAVTPRPRRVPHPVLDEYLRLAAQLGCQADSRQMRLAITPAEQAVWDRFVERHARALGTRPIVCFNTGGAFGPAKMWPRASFAELARKLVDAHPAAVVVLCGPAEREDARWIVAAADHPQVLTVADEPLSIGLTKAAIAGSQLLVTTDSGPRHFAAAFGVPVVTLFGPTHIAWSETHFAQAVHVQLQVPCGPCQQRTCPLGHHRCLRDLTVEQVYAAAQPLISSWRQAA